MMALPELCHRGCGNDGVLGCPSVGYAEGAPRDVSTCCRGCGGAQFFHETVFGSATAAGALVPPSQVEQLATMVAQKWADAMQNGGGNAVACCHLGSGGGSQQGILLPGGSSGGHGMLPKGGQLGRSLCDGDVKHDVCAIYIQLKMLCW